MENNYIDIIQLILKCSQNVLFINNEYYIVLKWIPADNKTYFKHTLEGFVITDFIKKKYSLMVNATKNAMYDEVSKLINKDILKIEFSANLDWILYLN